MLRGWIPYRQISYIVQKKEQFPPTKTYMHTYHTISECFSSHSHGKYGMTYHIEIRLLCYNLS